MANKFHAPAGTPAVGWVAFFGVAVAITADHRVIRDTRRGSPGVPDVDMSEAFWAAFPTA